MQLAAEWLPVSTVVYQPPAKRVGDLLTYIDSHALGPREAQAMASMMQTAQDRLPKPEAPQRDFQTTYRSEHIAQDMTGLECAVSAAAGLEQLVLRLPSPFWSSTSSV